MYQKPLTHIYPTFYGNPGVDETCLDSGPIFASMNRKCNLFSAFHPESQNFLWLTRFFVDRKWKLSMELPTHKNPSPQDLDNKDIGTNKSGGNAPSDLFEPKLDLKF